MFPERIDVVIVGGGPAGSATALALRRHDPSLAVVLVEASGYGEARIGETLPPNARPLLGQLGVLERFLDEGHLEAYGTSSSWGRSDLEDNDFMSTVRGTGWHLDRRRFDAFLAREAERRGVDVALETRLAGEKRTAEGWEIELRPPNARSEVLRARHVVDASGRGARFAGRQGARRVLFDYLAGVFLFFGPGERSVPPDTRTLVEPVEMGWWYSARLPDGGLVTAFMTDSDLVRREGLDDRKSWLDALDQSRHTKERLTGLEPRGEPRVWAASSGRLDTFGGEGWTAVGDAASTFDPLSGQGIAKALRNGLWAAYAVSDALAGRAYVHARYERLLHNEFESYLETREHYYRQEARWPEADFWSRRRPEITLDPHLSLVCAADAVGSPEKLRMHLPSSVLTRLIDLFATPRPPHEAVAILKEESALPLSDRRIVLALQYLLEQGIFHRQKPRARDESKPEPVLS